MEGYGGRKMAHKWVPVQAAPSEPETMKLALSVVSVSSAFSKPPPYSTSAMQLVEELQWNGLSQKRGSPHVLSPLSFLSDQLQPA